MNLGPTQVKFFVKYSTGERMKKKNKKLVRNIKLAWMIFTSCIISF